MEEYYRELRKIKLLSPEQEYNLWISFKENNKFEARQELIRVYQPLVYKVVSRYSSDRELMLDLIQEGNIGLIDAVDSYDYLRGVRFSTFATYYIRGRVVNFLKKGIKENIFMQDYAEEMFDRKIEINLLFEKISKAIESLPGKEQKILKEIYLVNKEPQLVATEMGISLSYLYRLQKKAIKRVRGKMAKFIQHWKG